MNRVIGYDYIFILIFAVLALWSADHFWSTGSGVLSSSSGQQRMGIIAGVSSTVKKKSSDSLVWRDSLLGDELYLFDQVYTHDYARAELLLEDGAKINLMEKTLFKLEHNGQDSAIDLREGLMTAILGEGQSRLKLLIEGEEYILSGEKAKVQIEHNKDKSRISLLSGHAELKKGKAKQTIGVKESLELDHKTKKMQINKIAIVLENPAWDEKIWKKSPLSVLFRWNAISGAESYILELSQGRTFVDKKEFRLSSISHQLALEAGYYYWKIKGFNSQKQLIGESLTSSFQLALEKPIIQLQPYSDEKVSFWKTISGKSVDGSLSFSWSSQQASAYLLQLRDEQEKVFEYKVSGERYIWQNPPLGLWSWRVKVLDSKRTDAYWSSWRPFLIAQYALPLPPKNFSLREESQLTVYDYEKDGVHIPVSWEADQGETAFEFVLLDHAGKTLQRISINDTKYLIPLSEGGKFSYKVRTLDAQARETQFSSPISFGVEIVHPIANRESAEKVLLKRPDQKVSIEWQGEGESFIFELAEDKSFAQVIRRMETNEQNISVSFARPGTYFWRVTNLKGNARALPKMIKIEPAPPPEPLHLEDKKIIPIRWELIPAKTSSWFNWLIDAAIADSAEYKKFIRLNWKKVEDAKEYLVQISDSRSFKSIIWEGKTKEAFLDWERNQEGTIYWRVAIIDFWARQTAFSNVAEVEVILPPELRPLDRPQLKKLNKSEVFQGEKVSISWNEVARSLFYDVYLVHEKGEEKKVGTFKRGQTTISTKSLQEGLWDINVISYGKHKLKSSEKVASFLVKKKKVIKPKRKKIVPAAKLQLVSPVPISKNFRAVNLFINQVNYESDELKFDGLQMLDLAYIQKHNRSWGSFRFRSGKIFDDIAFRTFAIRYLYDVYNVFSAWDFEVGGVLEYGSQLSFEVDQAEETKEISALLSGRLSYIFDRNRISLDMGIGQGLNLGIKAIFPYKRFFWGPSLEYSRRADGASFSQMGLDFASSF